MQTTELKLLKFNELSEKAKEAVIRFYEGDILPAIISDEYEGIYHEALKGSGVLITLIDLDKIQGKFDASPEFVLDRIIETGLVDKEDSEYNYYKWWYKHILEMDKEINELKEENNFNEACKLMEKREKSFEEWKEEFLEFVLGRYHSFLHAVYEYYLEEDFVSEFFNSNDFSFTEDGKIYCGSVYYGKFSI